MNSAESNNQEPQPASSHRHVVTKPDPETVRQHRRYVFLLRAMEGAVTLVLLAVTVVFIVGFFPIRHKAITRIVTREIAAWGLDSCAVGHVVVRPWRGLKLENVGGCVRLGNRQYSAEVGELEVTGNIVMMVLRRHDFSRLVEPLREIAALSGADPLDAVRRLVPLAAEVPIASRLKLSGTDYTVLCDDSMVVAFRNVAMQLQRNEEEVTGIRGEFEADHLMGPAYFAEHLKGEFEAGSGRLSVTKCKGKSLGGKFRLEFGLDLESRTLDHLETEINDMDLAQYYRGDTTSGLLAGTADLKLELSSSPLHPDSLRGRGSLHAAKLTAINLPVQRSLVLLLVIPKLAEVEFRKVRSDFEITQGRVIAAETSGESDVINFKAAGWINMRGELNQQVEGMFPRKFASELPPLVKQSLEQTDDSGRQFACRIYGTFSEPRMEIDRTILRRAVSGMFGTVRDNLMGIFR